jgi:hypothetical protein
MERRGYQPRHPSKNTKESGPPQKPHQFLGFDVLEWYHPTVSRHQQEKVRKGWRPVWMELQP